MSEPLPPTPPPPAAPPPPPPMAPPPAGGQSSNRGVMLVLSYLGLLALIPYFVEQQDQEVRWHARHGLVLAIAEIVVFVVLSILSSLGPLGCIFAPFMLLLGMGVLILHIMMIVKALDGKRLLVPGISQYADKL